MTLCPPSPCRYVRPGGGFTPNFQLFQKGDVNGAKEQKVYTFLKVGAMVVVGQHPAWLFWGARQ